jgi:Flp pilus assembly protein TadG
MTTDERGQGTVEMLFVLMVLILMAFGAFELGQGVLLKHALDVSTEKGARMLSINPGDFGAAEATIRQEVDANLLGGGYGSQVSVRLYDAGTQSEITPVALSSAPFGYRFLVAAELPWQAQVPFMALSHRTLWAAHHGVVDRIRP